MRWPLWIAGRAIPERTAKSRGPGLPTLRSSWRVPSLRRRLLKSPAHRGERVYAVTPSCREGRIAPVEPVVSNSCAFFTAHEAAGATSARPSLRPLFSEGQRILRKLGQNALRDRERMSVSVAGASLPDRRLPRRPLRLDLVLRHDEVAATLFGLI